MLKNKTKTAQRRNIMNYVLGSSAHRGWSRSWKLVLLLTLLVNMGCSQRSFFQLPNRGMGNESLLGNNPLLGKLKQQRQPPVSEMASRHARPSARFQPIESPTEAVVGRSVDANPAYQSENLSVQRAVFESSGQPVGFSMHDQGDHAEPESIDVPVIRPIQGITPSLEPSKPKSETRVFRGQDQGYGSQNGQSNVQQDGNVQPVMYQDAGGDPYFGVPTVPNGFVPNNGPGYFPGRINGNLDAQPTGTALGLPQNFADIMVPVAEGQSGQVILGAAVNSDAGVTGQLIVSEKNFDIARFPTSFADMFSREGTAFRGNGQGFRLEAAPGNNVQRYLVSFTEPYLFNTRVSLSTSGYYFTRDYFDWTEQRLGGRMALGYRLSPDLSLSAGVRAENVKVFDPRVNNSTELNAALGRTDLFIGQVTLTHDTRDHPFLATQGHFFELDLQQGFGEFDFPRAELDYRRYFLVKERPDGSGRHTLSMSTKLGFTGAQTPIFENFFAGGFSTMRGFDFRGASPEQNGVRVGGEFQMLSSVEYMFPLTADDMVRGVVFCDYGTVEENIEFDKDNFRVAPGFGFRVNVPFGGAGGAPLAFDFAFPIAKADTDDTRVFAFYMGFGRNSQ